ncbi:MAG: transposase [Gammaproteobacteria bacterium]|nr:transposase [Gammaproteobacteria bacterium]
MPRRPRFKLAGIPVHLIQRGNNREACFFAEDDYQFYLDHLGEACKKHAVDLHAYVLMTNHVHLLMTPNTGEGPSQVMKHLGQRYVQHVKRTHRRSGTLWEGRFRTCLVGEEDYFLGCQRYIELNPVRADMVKHPGEYPWPRYGHIAQGFVNALIQPHALYKWLGRSIKKRQEAYRELFPYEIDPGLVEEIRSATNDGFVLGTERFQKEIAVMLDRCAWRGSPGRSVKAETDEDQQELEL